METQGEKVIKRQDGPASPSYSTETLKAVVRRIIILSDPSDDDGRESAPGGRGSGANLEVFVLLLLLVAATLCTVAVYRERCMLDKA